MIIIGNGGISDRFTTQYRISGQLGRTEKCSEQSGQRSSTKSSKPDPACNAETPPAWRQASICPPVLKTEMLAASNLPSHTVARLRSRLDNQSMIDLLDRWASCRERAAERLPTLADMLVSDNDRTNADRLCVEVVISAEPYSFRIIDIGPALARHLHPDEPGPDLAGRIIMPADERVLGSLASTYQRAARGTPHFDYARIRLGLATELHFERLMLPISTDGQRVTHLLGIVTFEEKTFY